MPIKSFKLIGLFLFFLIIACSVNTGVEESSRMGEQSDASADDAPEASPFVLGVGDEIEIRVWRNSELNRSLAVDPDGYIYLPMVGEVMASGMTIRELRETITDRLSKYIVNPVVDINATNIQSQKYYILGEVKSPGVFRFKEKTNAIGGIILAGGFTDDADLKKVMLLRNTKGTYKARAIDLDVTNITETTQLGVTTSLEHGDIVYVPPKFIADLERFMKRFNNMIVPIVNLQRAIIFMPDVVDVLKYGEVKDGENTGAIVPP